jgi:hypothetical protein
MKLKRTIRYHHLTRDLVDEAGYPPTQEYILYSHNKVRYAIPQLSTVSNCGVY